ncbi:DNA polymerase subunit Cdc27 [Lanmaoa asiatica]|nr:DNA polymerase subunit Cdc27 [Lanmaoa asiatica]
MTTKNARDFLDKELFVKRSVVTFRSLSRELGIHVNDAKNQLQLYYDAVRDTDAPAVPTYLVSGEVPALTISPHPETQQPDSAMDMDLEFEEDRGEIDVVHQSKVLLVDARTLDGAHLVHTGRYIIILTLCLDAMSQFSRIYSAHIYSYLRREAQDAGLVCTPSFKVHKADAKGGPTSFSVVGKITGSHVKLRAGTVYQSAASSSKTTLDVSARVAPRTVTRTGAEQQTTKGKAPSPGTKEHVSTTTTLPKAEPKDKPKPSGKLDWSKAKTKEKGSVAEKAREEKKLKLEPDSTITAKDFSTSKKPGLEPMKSSISKSNLSREAMPRRMQLSYIQREIRRKHHADTDLESESEPSSAKGKPIAAAGSSVEKGVVYSDEDDDGEVHSEMSLRAMMDIDDGPAMSTLGVRRRRKKKKKKQKKGTRLRKKRQRQPATSEDEESDYAPVVSKKRKPRKVVPVGRNGLKKRRVTKSRTTTDAKGYMQTEDYSSYESVEEEEEAVTKPKGKGKGTKKALEPKVEEPKPKGVDKNESIGKLKTKAAPKPRGGAPKRGGLLNFFGPERGKK